MSDSEFENICDRFDALWQQGEPIQIEKLLENVDPGAYEEIFRNLLEIEVEYRIRGGENPAVMMLFTGTTRNSLLTSPDSLPPWLLKH